MAKRALEPTVYFDPNLGIVGMPDDVLKIVFGNLRKYSISLMLVCKKWRSFCEHSNLFIFTKSSSQFKSDTIFFCHHDVITSSIEQYKTCLENYQKKGEAYLPPLQEMLNGYHCIDYAIWLMENNYYGYKPLKEGKLNSDLPEYYGTCYMDLFKILLCAQDERRIKRIRDATTTASIKGFNKLFKEVYNYEVTMNDMIQKDKHLKRDFDPEETPAIWKIVFQKRSATFYDLVVQTFFKYGFVTKPYLLLLEVVWWLHEEVNNGSTVLVEKELKFSTDANGGKSLPAVFPHYFSMFLYVLEQVKSHLLDDPHGVQLILKQNYKMALALKSGTSPQKNIDDAVTSAVYKKVVDCWIKSVGLDTTTILTSHMKMTFDEDLMDFEGGADVYKFPAKVFFTYLKTTINNLDRHASVTVASWYLKSIIRIIKTIRGEDNIRYSCKALDFICETICELSSTQNFEILLAQERFDNRTQFSIKAVKIICKYDNEILTKREIVGDLFSNINANYNYKPAETWDVEKWEWILRAGYKPTQEDLISFMDENNAPGIYKMLEYNCPADAATVRRVLIYAAIDSLEKRKYNRKYFTISGQTEEANKDDADFCVKIRELILSNKHLYSTEICEECLIKRNIAKEEPDDANDNFGYNEESEADENQDLFEDQDDEVDEEGEE